MAIQYLPAGTAKTETSAQTTLTDLPAQWATGTRYTDGTLSAIADTG